jgi:NAD(P)H-hydrate epimerase
VKPRDPYSHKGDFGCLLIVGGSDVYSGAPALTGLAAIRTGAGLVLIAAPKATTSTIRSYSPDLIVHQLSGDVVTPDDVPKLQELLVKSTALVLGPGIGRAPETEVAVPQILKTATEMGKPVLVDADAIRAVAGTGIKHSNIVLTPHAGEFRALSGIEAPVRWRDRLPFCVEFAKKTSCILLLKGHETVITDGVRVKVNRTGNPGMARGGMGDVLSGIIGAFLAQQADPFLAAVAGAYVHGHAGDLLLKTKGFHMTASDLVDTLPTILRKFDRTATHHNKLQSSLL